MRLGRANGSLLGSQKLLEEARRGLRGLGAAWGQQRPGAAGGMGCSVSAPVAASSATTEAGTSALESTKKQVWHSVTSAGATVAPTTRVRSSYSEYAGGTGDVAHARCASASHIGAGSPPLKKENQDVVRVRSAYGENGDLFLAICLDGHGSNGRVIAEAAADWLEDNTSVIIAEHGAFGSLAEWDECLTRVFLECNKAIKENPDIGHRANSSGATLTMAIMHDDMLHVANVGDSRMIIGYTDPQTGKLAADEVTTDHRPELGEERARIEEAGGVVMPSKKYSGKGPLRVWLCEADWKRLGFAKPVPGLMCTRSIGDELSKIAGCTARPSVQHRELKRDKHHFFVMASDGIWDAMSNSKVVRLVQKHQREGSSAIANAIVTRALAYWEQHEQADNIGVIYGSLWTGDDHVLSPGESPGGPRVRAGLATGERRAVPSKLEEADKAEADGA